MEKHAYVVRTMTSDDIPQVEVVQAKAYPEMKGWTSAQLAKHLEVFPEGQWVVVDDKGKVVGSASSLIIDWDDYAESAQWSTITGDGFFTTHNPLGKTLYGADMAVDPDVHRKGIGTLLYDERKKLVKQKGLKRILTGGRIPGYAAVSHELSAKEYVRQVIRGVRKDPTLSFQLKNGFFVLDIIPEYLEDPGSRGFATLLEWLNPDYQMHVLLEEHPEAPAEFVKEAALKPTVSRRIRIATMQYLLRPIESFKDFATQVEFFVKSAADYNSQFILFPELFTMQLLSYMREGAPGRAVRLLADLTPQYEELFLRLSGKYKLYIIAGTHPTVQQGELFNAAHLFTPKGKIFRQKKVHLTPTEKYLYQMSRGHGFYIYHTEFGRIAILVCYDVEFPEAARVLSQNGAEIIFVPSCTDERQGFLRVRNCAIARTIENQIYVVMSGTVGNLPDVPTMAANYSQAAIFTPSDYFFARDGIAAEGTLNQEMMVISDVDLALLYEERANGTVVPLKDIIIDAYDRVIHYRDTV